MIMVKEMVKEILKKEVEVVRVDVVEKDELMAYSNRHRGKEKVGVMEDKWRSL